MLGNHFITLSLALTYFITRHAYMLHMLTHLILSLYLYRISIKKVRHSSEEMKDGRIQEGYNSRSEYQKKIRSGDKTGITSKGWVIS